jgi:hypothetical protein
MHWTAGIASIRLAAEPDIDAVMRREADRERAGAGSCARRHAVRSWAPQAEPSLA